MVDPYSAETLINKQVWIFGDDLQIHLGYVVKFIEEENIWLIAYNQRMVKRTYSELGQVVGFFDRYGPTYQNPKFYDLVKDKFVLSGGQVTIQQPAPAEEDGLSINNIFVLMNGIGIIMG